jgi:DNA polymerase-3 subunit beta
MDFYITKEEVVKSLNLTLGVVEKRQTLPILSKPTAKQETRKDTNPQTDRNLGKQALQTTHKQKDKRSPQKPPKNHSPNNKINKR